MSLYTWTITSSELRFRRQAAELHPAAEAEGAPASQEIQAADPRGLAVGLKIGDLLHQSEIRRAGSAPVVAGTADRRLLARGLGPVRFADQAAPDGGTMRRSGGSGIPIGMGLPPSPIGGWIFQHQLQHFSIPQWRCDEPLLNRLQFSSCPPFDAARPHRDKRIFRRAVENQKPVLVVPENIVHRPARSSCSAWSTSSCDRGHDEKQDSARGEQPDQARQHQHHGVNARRSTHKVERFAVSSIVAEDFFVSPPPSGLERSCRIPLRVVRPAQPRQHPVINIPALACSGRQRGSTS